jgi:quercetin dioxygenase-like cupin family protein
MIGSLDMLDHPGSAALRAPLIVPPHHGHTATAFGTETARIVVPSRGVGGAYGIWELVACPGCSPPRHIHHREDEIFHILEGEVKLWCGGESWVAGPGTTAMLPRGVPHSFRVIGAGRARMMMTVVPGGFETFFAAVSGLRVPGDEAKMIDISDDYGVSLIGPPLEG